MRVAFFSSRSYDRKFFEPVAGDHELLFLPLHLGADTVRLAEGCEGVCLFVNDEADEPTLAALAEGGTKVIALRSAGYNHVDLAAAQRHGLTVVRVPAYSPHAVAEHTVALMLSLNRRIHRAYARVREGNFALDGMLGFDLHGKTVGIVGLGRIGVLVAHIMAGFGCRVLGYDPHANADDIPEIAKLSGFDELLAEADIVSLHCPLTPQTHHLIDQRALAAMKPGVMLINTSRGGLVDTRAVVGALKSGHIGHLGLDVYEEEGDLFFDDLSNEIIGDDVFSRLLTFPNVLITGHQAFFTREALEAIASTTMANIDAYAAGKASGNEVTAEGVAGPTGS